MFWHLSHIPSTHPSATMGRTARKQQLSRGTKQRRLSMLEKVKVLDLHSKKVAFWEKRKWSCRQSVCSSMPRSIIPNRQCRCCRKVSSELFLNNCYGCPFGSVLFRRDVNFCDTSLSLKVFFVAKTNLNLLITDGSYASQCSISQSIKRIVSTPDNVNTSPKCWL